MMKNLMVLALLAWVSLSYARPDSTLQRESLKEAEAYKVEQPVPAQQATRGVAGSKIKKKKDEIKTEEPSREGPRDADSEVRYWQYSE
jgi:hypothetical protein